MILSLVTYTPQWTLKKKEIVERVSPDGHKSSSTGPPAGSGRAACMIMHDHININIHIFAEEMAPPTHLRHLGGGGEHRLIDTKAMP